MQTFCIRACLSRLDVLLYQRSFSSTDFIYVSSNVYCLFLILEFWNFKNEKLLEIYKLREKIKKCRLHNLTFIFPTVSVVDCSYDNFNLYNATLRC